MNAEMKLYYDYTVSPLGKVFYQTVWKQLDFLQGHNILDFGSGFGFTADYLAQNNTVTAIEMDQSMIAAGKNTHNFKQICGDIKALKALPTASFDTVLCHLVFEFADNAEEILTELLRVLKAQGTLSVVRHNRAGRIIQAVVQQRDFLQAHELLQGEPSYSSAFGNICYYENEDLYALAKHSVEAQAVYGVRALASLHAAEVQEEASWLSEMLALEWELLKNPHFVSIAYFNHLLLKKKTSA